MTTALIEFVAPWLVDHPDELTIEEVEDERGTLVLELSLHPDDMGKIIGRQGRTIRAAFSCPRRRAAPGPQHHDRGGGLSDSSGKVLAGEIGKPHGVAGEVYVLLLSDDPGRFAAGDRLVHEDGRSLTVAQSRAHKGDRFLVKFEGVDSRDEAERLRGKSTRPRPTRGSWSQTSTGL